MAGQFTRSLVRGQGKSSDPRWFPHMVCASRYPGLEGIELQSAIFSDYIMTSEDVRLPY